MDRTDPVMNRWSFPFFVYTFGRRGWPLPRRVARSWNRSMCAVVGHDDTLFHHDLDDGHCIHCCTPLHACTGRALGGRHPKERA